MRRLQFEDHNGDNDGDNAIAKCDKPVSIVLLLANASNPHYHANDAEMRGDPKLASN